MDRFNSQEVLKIGHHPKLDNLGRGIQRGVLFQTMLNAGTLTFEEFAMREQLLLATIHEAVLDFLRGRALDFPYFFFHSR